MKRLCILMCLALLARPALAQQSLRDANEAIGHKVADQIAKYEITNSPGARDKGVLMSTLTVEAYLPDWDAALSVNNSTLHKPCPLVRISSHYLQGSYACVGLSEEGSFRHGDDEHDTKHKVERSISSIVIGDNVIEKANIFENRDLKIFVVKLDPNNQKLRELIQPIPAVNLVVAKNPQTLKLLFSNVILNRDKVCGKGRACADDLSIGKCFPDEGCFELKGTYIKGKSGDPVFGAKRGKHGYEFLIGFNVTDVYKDQPQKGKNYHFFSKKTLDFLKGIMGKESLDWKQLDNKKVDEYYFAS